MSTQLHIPSFRRAESFVGTSEGFDLFSPLSLEGDFPTSPKILNVSYTFPKMDTNVRCTRGPLNFDMASVGNNMVLGAIPAQDEQLIQKEWALQHDLTAKKPSNDVQDENVISCGTYTRAER